MTGLRTYAGVGLQELHARWGVDLRDGNANLLGRLESEGLLTQRDDRLIPTLDGLAVADGMASSFSISCDAP